MQEAHSLSANKVFSEARMSVRFHRLLNGALKLLFWILLRCEVQGLQNVPLSEPMLIIVNHINFLDAVVTAVVLPRDMYLMTKIETFNAPVFNWVIWWYGVFSVRRGEVDRMALRQALNILEGGGVLLVAPEGTRSGDGLMQQARNGVAYLATKADVPILPVAVWGVEEFWKRFPRLKRTKVNVRVGVPFTFQASESRLRRNELTQMTEEAMLRLADLLPPEYRGYYSEELPTSWEYIEPFHLRSGGG